LAEKIDLKTTNFTKDALFESYLPEEYKKNNLARHKNDSLLTESTYFSTDNPKLELEITNMKNRLEQLEMVNKELRDQHASELLNSWQLDEKVKGLNREL
jgi:hypothetical protein